MQKFETVEIYGIDELSLSREARGLLNTYCVLAAGHVHRILGAQYPVRIELGQDLSTGQYYATVSVFLDGEVIRSSYISHKSILPALKGAFKDLRVHIDLRALLQ
jgi:hypothetical protein